MTEENRDAVNTGFNAKLAELVVLRSKRDNNVDVKNAPANLDDSESLGGDDSFSTGDEGGEEEEDEAGSGGDGDEGSGEDGGEGGGSNDGSDAGSDVDPDGEESEQPSTSDGRMVLYVRKTREPPKVYKTKDTLELDAQEFRGDQILARGRSKCDDTIRSRDDSSGSDMDVGEVSEGNGSLFAGQPVVDEMLMRERSDPREESMDDMMLPAHKGFEPEGNR